MPAPIDPAKRAAIAAAIAAGGTCRGIAREYEVSADTVRRIAAEAGIAEPFARTATKNATKARRLDNAAMRAEVSRTYLEKARALLRQMDEPHMAFAFGGRDNVYTEHLMDRPPVDALRNLMITSATAFDKHLLAERFDADDGAADAASLVKALADGLGVAAERLASGGASDRSGQPAAEPQADPLDR